MFLESFRDLLNKKIVNQELKKTLLNTTDSILIDHVIETLEKMARHARQSAKENISLSNFVSQMDPDTDHAEAHFIRDAMGHHASHYKAALQAGNQDLANTHAKEFIKLGHLAHKIERIDPSKMKFDTIDLQPWQATRSDLFSDPHKTSGVDLTGWRCHKKMKGGKDFSWLQNPPHASRSNEIFSKPHETMTNPDGTVEHRFHNDAFPMEHVKINGKHIPIDDDIDVSHGHFTPHSFDMHPIMSVFDESASTHTPEKASSYQDRLSKFHDSVWGKNLLAKLGEFISPEHGAVRGSTVHKPVENPLQKPQDRNTPASLDSIASSEEQKHNENVSDLLAGLGLDNSNLDEEK